MNSKRKYLLLTLVALAAFLYLLTTEVSTRWSDLWIVYQQFSEKEDALLDPVALTEKKTALLEQKTILTSSVAKTSGQFEQSQTGVVAYLNSCSKKSAVKIESLTPLPSQGDGQFKTIAFKIGVVGSYHPLGAFVNAIETGTMNINVKNLEISSPRSNRGMLQLHLEGSASVLAGGDAK